MLAYTYIEQGKFELREKPIPEIQDSWDAIVRVTLGSICSRNPVFPEIGRASCRERV